MKSAVALVTPAMIVALTLACGPRASRTRR
jgi:hypothetical protein